MARVSPGDPAARHGLLITFEGGDGAGKSTQARRLRGRLARAGHCVRLVAEPGGTVLGKRLRRLLKFSRHEITPEAELLLFLASRAQLTQEIILPSLAQGAIVVCDRYADSTAAYQGYGRGLDLERIHRLNAGATQGLRPHLTVLMDVPPEEALQRRAPEALDRMERGAAEFHVRVRQGYHEMARNEPGRWLVVDARLPKAEVARTIWERVSSLLPSPS